MVVSHDGTVTNKRPCATPSTNIYINDENETVGHSVTRQSFRNLIIPPQTVNFITGLCRTTTKYRYESVLRRWIKYAELRNRDLYTADVNTLLAFLHSMYLYECLYSSLCHSALSSVVTIKGFILLSDHPLISRYLKGNYNRHPA